MSRALSFSLPDKFSDSALNRSGVIPCRLYSAITFLTLSSVPKGT